MIHEKKSKYIRKSKHRDRDYRRTYVMQIKSSGSRARTPSVVRDL